jgi:hypothetical protein
MGFRWTGIAVSYAVGSIVTLIVGLGVLALVLPIVGLASIIGLLL